MSKKSKNNTSKILVFIALLIGISIITCHQYFFVFNPQSLVENSKLGNNNFETEIIEITSPIQGIRAYLFKETTNPIISINFLFSHAGRAIEKENEQGIANLTAAIMSEAAGKYKSQDFKEELENLAISIGYAATLDDFSGSLLTTRENADKAFEMLRLTLVSPRLDKNDLNLLKNKTLVALQRQQENPQTRLSLIAAKEIYGDHPYSRNPYGVKDNIEKIDAKKIRNFIKSNLGKDNLVVGIAGDIDEVEAAKMLDYVFGDLPQTGAQDVIEQPKIDFGKHMDIEDDLPQAISTFITKGTPRLAEDFYPLYIANYVLGGSGLNSRLNQAAREKEGLTYGIYTGLANFDKVSLIQGGFSSTPNNFPRVKEILLQEWKKMGADGITLQELVEAKNYLISSFNLRFADMTNISEMLVYMQKDKLGIDFLSSRNGYIKAVKLGQVIEAAKKYYNPEELIIINLGKFNTSGENE